MSNQHHWEEVYETKRSDRVGWYTPHLEISLKWIDDLHLDPDAPVIDVGGGASTLVDDLLERGFHDLTVLDLSDRALAVARERLGHAASQVNWIVGDVTEADLPTDHFRLWHDRAVFHFLVDAGDREKYREKLLRTLKQEGYFLIGTFDLAGPDHCSGLPVQRYSADEMQAFLGAAFQLLQVCHETHTTPSGVEQRYLYGLFQRKGRGG